MRRDRSDVVTDNALRSMLDTAIAYPNSPSDVCAMRTWLGGLSKNEISKLVILGKSRCCSRGPCATTWNLASSCAAWRARSAPLASNLGSIAFRERPARLQFCGCSHLYLPKIISGRNGGAAQTRLGWLQ